MIKTLTLIVLFLILPVNVFANSIVADLSTDSIGINAGFNGANLLLFGAIEGDNADDLVVTVEGPKTEVTVYKKGYISGIWVNKESVTFVNVPSFYYIATSNHVISIKNFDALIRNNIGGANLNLKILEDTKLTKKELNIWRNSLTRRMENNRMWVSTTGLRAKPVEVIKNKLFRAPVTLPASVLPGDYIVTVYQIRNGSIEAKETTSMVVRKTGFEASIYKFAHEYSALYGLFAILIAIAAGYAAAQSFRKT